MFQLRNTPFHERTSKLCLPQNWRRWAGYIVVGSYELTLDREYWAIRNSAALIDVSPLMKYIIKGTDASRLLNRVVTRDMDKMKVGQVYYTGWCDDEGKMIDDGTISRLDEATFRMTSADPSLRWLSMNAVGLDVEITEVTDNVAALSLQGPNSRKMLNKVADDPVDGLKYFRLMQNQVDGIPVTISRTGYTGDLGFEIWMEAEDALTIWDALMEAGARLWHHACGHPRDGHGARGSGAVHDRSGLHVHEPRLDRAAEVVAVRAGTRLGGGARQAGLFRRPPRAGTREARRLCVEVGRARSGMGGDGAVVRRRRPAAANPRHGGARQLADHGWAMCRSATLPPAHGRRC